MEIDWADALEQVARSMYATASKDTYERPWEMQDPEIRQYWIALARVAAERLEEMGL